MFPLKAQTETIAPYLVDLVERAPLNNENSDAIIARALEILDTRLRHTRASIGSPAAVRAYLALSLADLQHEEFGVLMLDAQNRLIADRRMFRGTLTQTSVYPREVVKQCLVDNASAVILYHNHPSGVAEPSRADELLTQTLKQALALVDVRVLDHLIAAGTQTVSMAERGLL